VGVHDGLLLDRWYVLDVHTARDQIKPDAI
jgi:hypothetical protein